MDSTDRGGFARSLLLLSIQESSLEKDGESGLEGRGDLSVDVCADLLHGRQLPLGKGEPVDADANLRRVVVEDQVSIPNEAPAARYGADIQTVRRLAARIRDGSR